MNVKRATYGRLVDDVIKHVEQEIAKGTYKVGEKLPQPQLLQESLGVSRGTLREALRVLEQMGLIELKPGVGGGAFVCPISLEPTTQSLALLIRHRKVSLAHLAEFRVENESVMVSLAAEKATPEDIQKLKKLLDKSEHYFNKGFFPWSDFDKIDEEFHMILADIVNNPLFKVTSKALHANLHKHLEKISWNEGFFIESYQVLQKIIQAIEDKDAALAYNITRKHVRRFYQFVIDYKLNNDDIIEF